MKDDFYIQFEQAFRGGRPEIKDRLQIYLPFIESLVDLYPKSVALDLGCGRGEWLEVLRDVGLSAFGVDLDDSMLAECRNLGLDVSTQDAISALNALEDESISIVSAFHLIEHIPFDILKTLVSESMRVLKPGGLLIMETPNSDNIMVATSRFYFDPTHTRPIPVELLKFLLKYYGFCNTAVFGLQESAELREKIAPSLQDVLGGASPDYAVITQKSAHESIIDRFKTPFALDLGLTTDTLVRRFDQRITQERSELTQSVVALTQSVAALNKQINAVYNSSSWKVTRPLRALSTGLRHIKALFKRTQ